MDEMVLYLDYRESRLLEECVKLKGEHPSLVVETKNLEVGDMTFSHYLVERKTWSDLEASIKDGRYHEQSFRLETAQANGFKIYYMLEGSLLTYTGSLARDALLSAMFNMTKKGFFVLQPANVEETARYLMRMVELSQVEKPVMTYEEASVIKKKNSHVTRDNISLYMLSQIPSVSITTASLLMEKYGHVKGLILAMEKNPKEMEEFTYVQKDPTKTKPKKLNKNVVQNLNSFLA
jgi:ERCC4-type nuclease